MISAVPCIATLIQLHEAPPLNNEDGTQVTGRVLLQNKLSLAYWGKLTVKNETGGTTGLISHSLQICCCCVLLPIVFTDSELISRRFPP